MAEHNAPNKSIPVLAVIPSLGSGGSERVMTTLMRHFDPVRVDATLAVVDGRQAVLASALSPDSKWLDLGCKRVLLAAPKLCRLIWRSRPRLVMSTLGHLNLMLALVKPLLPRGTVLVARESNVLSDQILTEHRPVLWRWACRRFYPRLDHIVCQSRAMQDDLCDNFGIDRNKTSLIPNPVDVNAIAKLSLGKPGETTRLRTDGEVRLVAVGRMAPQKGFDVLLHAVQLLNHSSVHVDLVGDGPDLPQLRALAQSLGITANVHFHGFQSNPYLWMREADALVLSSRFEGLPNVVIEALACGTPVISCPIPPALEIINGIEQAVAARGMSAQDLADAIALWLSGPRERVPSEHIARFEVAAVTRQYEAVLRHVAASV